MIRFPNRFHASVTPQAFELSGLAVAHLASDDGQAFVDEATRRVDAKAPAAGPGQLGRVLGVRISGAK